MVVDSRGGSGSENIDFDSDQDYRQGAVVDLYSLLLFIWHRLAAMVCIYE